MADLKYDTIFQEKLLNIIPINYRYMVKWETDNVDELYVGTRFSRSEQHHASEYINSIYYKPISNIFIHKSDDN